MTLLALINIGIFIILLAFSYINASNELSEISALSSPEYLKYLIRPNKIRNCVDDNNCLKGLLQDEFKYTTLNEKPNSSGQDYDWIKLNQKDIIDKELMLKRGQYIEEYSQNHDCACHTTYGHIILGSDHYPRIILNASCQNNNNKRCHHGKTCKEIIYKVKVLTRRSDNDLSEEDRQLMQSTDLPTELDNDWKFKTIPVAVACQCSH